MTLSSPSRVRGFRFDLPAGCVELPIDDEDIDPQNFGALSAAVAGVLGLDSGDGNAAAAALRLATFGCMVGDGGVDYAAVGVYRSPDDAGRPIMVVLTSVGLLSDHHRKEIAIASLLDLHEAEGHGSVGRLALPAGPAVVVVREQESLLHVGDTSAPVLTGMSRPGSRMPTARPSRWSRCPPTRDGTGNTSARSRWTSSRASSGTR